MGTEEAGRDTPEIKQMPVRDDAVDLQVDQTRQEMIKDVSTNPVELGKKRRTRKQRELQKAEDTLDGEAIPSATDIQDEEQALHKTFQTQNK